MGFGQADGVKAKHERRKSLTEATGAGVEFFKELDVKNVGFLTWIELQPLAKYMFEGYGGTIESDSQLEHEVRDDALLLHECSHAETHSKKFICSLLQTKKLVAKLSVNGDDKVMVEQLAPYYEQQKEKVEKKAAKKAARRASQDRPSP